MSLKKIFLITNYTPDGGVNTMFKQIYFFFKSRKYTIITLFILNHKSKFNQNNYNFLNHEEIRFFYVKSNIESYKFIKKLTIQDFDKENDIIFSISGTALMNFVLRNYFEYKIFCWIATPYYEEKKSLIRKKTFLLKTFFYLVEIPLCKIYEKYIVRKLNDKIISLSNYTKQIFFSKYNRVTNILNCPIDIDKQVLPKKIKMNKFNIYFAGRLNDPRKNLSLFLDVVNLFNKNKYNDIQFYLIGGKLDIKEQYLIKHNKIKNLTVIPYLTKNDLYSYYSKMDMFLITSLQEGLCISAIEANLFNLPIVTTNCGGISDIVKDNVNGFFTNFDADDIKSKILILYNDKKIYNKFRFNCKKISDKFSVKFFNKSLERIGGF